MIQRCVGGLFYQIVKGYNITQGSLSKISVRGEDISNLPYLLSTRLPVTSYFKLSLNFELLEEDFLFYIYCQRIV